MFHDIEARQKDFGVYKLWDELRTKFPYLEFKHSYGLGVLFPKGYDQSFEQILSQKDKMKVLYEKKSS